MGCESRLEAAVLSLASHLSILQAAAINWFCRSTLGTEGVRVYTIHRMNCLLSANCSTGAGAPFSGRKLFRQLLPFWFATCALVTLEFRPTFIGTNKTNQIHMLLRRESD